MRRKGAVDPELVWCHDVIERQADQLKRLVDDLLDVSRITQGKIQLRLEPVALETVIGGAVETSAPLITAQRHQLRVTLVERRSWSAATRPGSPRWWRIS
jgi:signal transduction histidine kinase